MAPGEENKVTAAQEVVMPPAEAGEAADPAGTEAQGAGSDNGKPPSGQGPNADDANDASAAATTDASATTQDEAAVAVEGATESTLEERVTAAEAAASKAHERMLRVAADFENFKKRSRREATENTQQAENRVVLEFLPIVDNLERAIGHGGEGDTPDVSSLMDGVKMVHKQFINALGRYEVTPFDSVGMAFDPELHEALQQAPSDEPRNTVIIELQKGYRRGQRLVRPAMVVVSQGPAEAPVELVVEEAAEPAPGAEAPQTTGEGDPNGSDGRGEEAR